MALHGGFVAQLAPSGVELLSTIQDFIVASLFKYWWLLFALVLVWHARHYRDVVRSSGYFPGISVVSINRTLQHFGEMVTETTLRLVVFLFFAASGVLWLLEGVGTIAIGTTGLEPAMVASAVAILASVAAGLGVDWIRPWMVVVLFVAVVFGVMLFKQARRKTENV